MPPAGWQVMKDNQGSTPETRWFWNPTAPATANVKSDAQLRQGAGAALMQERRPR